MSSGSPFRVAVLASGTGTNLQAILDTVHGRDGIEVVAVASDKPGAMALDRATDAGIAAECFPRDGFDEPREARRRDLGVARRSTRSTWSSSPATCSSSRPSSSSAGATGS